MWVARARWAQVWLVVKLSVQHCRWVISNVSGHILCSKTAVPVWHRWILFLLFQTISLLWTRCLHCCPQMNDLCPSDVSRQQSLGLRSWPSCVVLSLQCTNPCSSAALNSINYITLFMPGCFVLSRDKFLHQCVGRFKVNCDVMFVMIYQDPPEFLSS